MVGRFPRKPTQVHAVSCGRLGDASRPLASVFSVRRSTFGVPVSRSPSPWVTGSARVRCLAWVSRGVGLCLASAVFGQPPARVLKAVPAWRVAEAPCRLVVEKGPGDFALFRVPAQLDGKPVAAVRAFAATNEVAVRVVWSDASEVTLLASVGALRQKQLIRIYPVPGGQAVAPVAAGLADPAPLTGVARRTAGMDFPASLADLRMLETRCDGKSVFFAVSDFSKLGTTFKEWFRGDWTRKSHLVALQTWLRVPEDGRYQFGLAGVAPAWLSVDGEEIMAHPAGQPFDAWTVGEDVNLRAGLRRVRIRTVCRQEIDTGLAWKRAGETGIATNVVMVTGGDLCDGRWEWRNRALHPYATAQIGRSYRFRGTDEVFVPYTLRDTTACWGTNYVVRWQAGTMPEQEGAAAGTLPVILRKSALPAPLTLRAVSACGEKAEYTTVLQDDGRVWAEYGVTTRITDVPAVCYDDDRVRPIIRIRSSALDGMAYELVSEIERLGGEREETTYTLVTERGWARVYLTTFRVGEVARVIWSLRHAGVEIGRGCLRFLREPVAVLPDVVSGGLLKVGPDFVVLVASRTARDTEPLSVPQIGTNGVAVLDGFLYGGTQNVECRTLNAEPGNEKPEIRFRVVDMQAVEQSETATGMTLLQPFTVLRSVLPADTVVVAPSLLAISREGGTEGFERRLAAMTGLLSGPACGSPRVLLTVPPAFDVLPGCGCVPGGKPCEHAAAARSYAESVMRVADAYGVETVDLFTAAKTAEGAVPLVCKGELTPEGRALFEMLLEKKGVSLR